MKTQHNAFGILTVSAVLAAGLFSAAKPAAASGLTHSLHIGPQAVVVQHFGGYEDNSGSRRDERRREEFRQQQFRLAELRRQQEIRRIEERRQQERRHNDRRDFQGDDRHNDNRYNNDRHNGDRGDFQDNR